jgi:hypothetical protein
MSKHILRNQTLIILDWDDTLFPTTWVTRNGINLMASTNRDQYVVYFKELDRVLSRLLKKMNTYGKILIVTNALPVWVNVSSVVLPKTYHVMKNIRVISAREKYSKTTGSATKWKEHAFKNEVMDEITHNEFLNIISVGDAEYEYKALISLNKYIKKTHKVLKAVRLMKEPSHDILIDQLEVLTNAFPTIYKKYGHMDMKFSHFSHNKKSQPSKI